MKTKTIRQMWAQLERIRNYFADTPTPEQVIKLNKACDTCNAMAKKAYNHIVGTGTTGEEAFDVPVSIEIYSK